MSFFATRNDHADAQFCRYRSFAIRHYAFKVSEGEFDAIFKRMLTE